MRFSKLATRSRRRPWPKILRRHETSMTPLARLGALILLVVVPIGSVQAQAPPPYSNSRGAPPPNGYLNPATSNGNFRETTAQGPAFPPDYGPTNLSAQPGSRIALAPTSGSSFPIGQSSETASQQNSQENADSAENLIQTNSFLTLLQEGGILMLPILFCSFVLFVFVLERLLFLRRGRVIPKPFVRGVLEQLEQQQLDQEEALELCRQNGSPIAELFVAALKRWGRPAVELEQAVVDAGAHITSQLRRYLRLFSAISNLTPLLGLLGTVLGMIDAFNSIAQADAMGRPELLASGIGAALLTTASGLSVAIPAYAAYAFFLARTDKLLLEMDALVANLVELTSAEALQSTRSRGRSRKAA